MNCTIHKDREASGCCAYCGKPFCEDCLVELKGRLFCKADLPKVLDKLAEQKAEQKVKKDYVSETDDKKVNIVINNSNDVNTNQTVNGTPILTKVNQRKNFLPTYLMWYFLGNIGGHRFYVGKIGTGLLYLFTFGFLGIGSFIDMILLFTDGFTDSNGEHLIVKSKNDKIIALCLLLVPIFFYLLLFIVSIGAAGSVPAN